METIIGILGAIAVLIFKVIEKKMKDSAQIPREHEEVFPDLREDIAEPEIVYVPKVKPVEVPKEKAVEVPKEKAVEVPKEKAPAPTKRNAPPVKMQKEASESPDKKEKIDPKKLVVYSEIMNRKY